MNLSPIQVNLSLTIALDPASLAALTGLAAALTGAAPQLAAAPVAAAAAPAAEKPSAPAAEAAATAAEGPVFWADNSTGDFGKVDDEAAYAARKAKSPNAFKITEAMYEERLAALREKNEAAAQEAKAAKAAAKAAAAAEKAAKAAQAEAKAAPAAEVSKEDVLEAYRAFLPTDLPADEKNERKAFVKAIVDRFGVKLIRDLSPDHYALALSLVQRKLAGEDIDPASSSFAEAAPHYAQQDDDLV